MSRTSNTMAEYVSSGALAARATSKAKASTSSRRAMRGQRRKKINCHLRRRPPFGGRLARLVFCKIFFFFFFFNHPCIFIFFSQCFFNAPDNAQFINLILNLFWWTAEYLNLALPPLGCHLAGAAARPQREQRQLWVAKEPQRRVRGQPARRVDAVDAAVGAGERVQALGPLPMRDDRGAAAACALGECYEYFVISRTFYLTVYFLLALLLLVDCYYIYLFILSFIYLFIYFILH